MPGFVHLSFGIMDSASPSNYMVAFKTGYRCVVRGDSFGLCGEAS